MSIELNLVTGYKGQAHVRAKDDGLLNAIILGVGSFVADYGNKFSAKLLTDNKVEIGDGVLFQNGRMAILESTSTISYQSGDPGYKRSDLIYAHYEINSSTGVESISIEYKKGSKGSTATMPTYDNNSILNDPNKADFPLYRIDFDGTTASTPVKLFNVLNKGRNIYDGTTLPDASALNDGDLFILWSN